MIPETLEPYMEESSIVLFAVDGPVANVTLNRPDIHNAFNADVVRALDTVFTEVANMPDVRAILLTGKGKSFSAGGDLAGMKQAGAMTDEDNLKDAMALSDMLHTMNRSPKPIFTVAHGNVTGGGVGLVACSDSVISVAGTRFALSEVRLGLEPSTISPYVVQAMGLRWARRLFTTGEFFSAERANAIGLVHDIVDDYDAAIAEAHKQISILIKNGPEAVAHAKDLAFEVHTSDITPDLRARTARRIADRRASAEALEGITAFLEKRKPNWIKD